MKAGWRVVPLGDVASFVMGQAPPGAACNFDGVGTPFVKAGEFGPDRPIIREWTTDPKKFAKATDVLICVVGATCGKINLGADCAIGRSVAAIRPQPAALDQFFLHYFLEGQVLALRGGSLGAAQTVISKDMLADLPIPLPPLDEQKRIVAVLDEAFEGLSRARANAEANLADARELFENIRSQVFACLPSTTPIFALGDICSRVSVGHVGETSKYYIDSAGIPFIRSQNVRPSGLDLSEIKQITPAFHASLKKSQLTGGELLFVRVGANRGDCCAMPYEIGATNCANIVFAKPKAGVLRYLEHFCQSRVGRAKLIGMTTGSAQGVINTRSVATLPIPMPSRDIQQKIADELDDLKLSAHRIANKNSENVQELDSLRQSLLQKAFSGELTE